MSKLENLKKHLYNLSDNIKNVSHKIKSRVLYDPRISMGTGLTMIAYNVEEWVNNLALNQNLSQYLNNLSKESPELAGAIGLVALPFLYATALPLIFFGGMALSLRGYELRKMLNEDFHGDFGNFVSYQQYKNLHPFSSPSLYLRNTL